MGIVLYAPVLVVCGVCVILAFHRAGVVRGEALWRVQLPSYVLLSGLVVSVLFGLHVMLDRKFAQSNISLSNLFVAAMAKQYPWLVSPPKAETPALPERPRSHQEASIEFTKTEIHTDDSVFMSGYPTTVIIGYKNTASGAAHDVYTEAIVELVKRHGNIYTSRHDLELSEREENKHFRAFRKNWLSHSYLGEGNDQQKDDEPIMVAHTPPLTWQETADVAAGRAYLYAFGAIKWHDDTGTYETDLCSFYNGIDGVESGVRKVVWTKCMSGHYRVRRPFDPFKD